MHTESMGTDIRRQFNQPKDTFFGFGFVTDIEDAVGFVGRSGARRDSRLRLRFSYAC